MTRLCAGEGQRRPVQSWTGVGGVRVRVRGPLPRRRYIYSLLGMPSPNSFWGSYRWDGVRCGDAGAARWVSRAW